MSLHSDMSGPTRVPDNDDGTGTTTQQHNIPIMPLPSQSPQHSIPSTHDIQVHISTPLPHHRRVSQPTLFQYLPPAFMTRYGDKSNEPCNETWGDNFTTKSQNSIRIWYTNPNGLGLNPNNTKSHNAFSFMYHKSKADVLCLAETNLRWPSLRHNSRLNSRIRTFFHDFYSSVSYNRHEDNGLCQRGGTCTIVFNQLSHRSHRSGSDPTGLGRWSWVQFQGKQGHFTRVITAYRPCRPPTMTALTTTWDQQTRYLRQQSLNSNPRQQVDIDIQNLLRSWIDMHIRIILCIDANDNLLEGTFLDTMNTLGLINAHSAYCNSPLPPTHERGSHPISGIFISPTLVPTRAGILRHGVGILGDHRNMFVDFHEYNVLGNEIYTIPPP